MPLHVRQPQPVYQFQYVREPQTDIVRKFGPFFLLWVVCTFLHDKTLQIYLHWDRGCMKYQKLRE